MNATAIDWLIKSYISASTKKDKVHLPELPKRKVDEWCKANGYKRVMIIAGGWQFMYIVKI